MVFFIQIHSSSTSGDTCLFLSYLIFIYWNDVSLWLVNTFTYYKFVGIHFFVYFNQHFININKVLLIFILEKWVSWLYSDSTVKFLTQLRLDSRPKIKVLSQLWLNSTAQVFYLTRLNLTHLSRSWVKLITQLMSRAQPWYLGPHYEFFWQKKWNHVSTPSRSNKVNFFVLARSLPIAMKNLKKTFESSWSALSVTCHQISHKVNSLGYRGHEIWKKMFF